MFNDSDSLKYAYRKHFRKSVLVISAIIVLTAIIIIISLSIAQYPIGFTESYHIMFNHITNGAPGRTPYDSWFKDYLVWNLNIPRAIGGVAVGVILGVGGAIMQSIIKNPLADPYTTGISSGALFGVTIYLVLGISVVPFAGSDLAQIMNAFIFALIPSAVIIFISSFKKTNPVMMVLIGIGVMYIFAASTTLLKFTSSSDTIADIYTWSIGSVGKITWGNLPIILGAMAFIIIMGMLFSKSLNVLSSGDNSALSLGVDPKKMRLISLIVVSIATAVAVCFTGTIGFVGLVAPHIARTTVGSNMRYLLPCSGAVGGLMLIAADCIARNAGSTGLPVGVITALIGSPLFLYFLIRQKKSAW